MVYFHAFVVIVTLLWALLVAYRLTKMGFTNRQLANFQLRFDERRQTDLGKKLSRPELIRALENRTFVALSVAVPLGIVIAALLLTRSQGVGAHGFLLMLLVPGEVLFQRFLISWSRQCTDNFDRYMELTRRGHQVIDTKLVDADWTALPHAPLSDRFLLGGKIITALFATDETSTWLRLFCPTSQNHLPCDGSLVRVFYDPSAKVIDNQKVDGAIVGYQLILRPVITMDEYERCRAEAQT